MARADALIRFFKRQKIVSIDRDIMDEMRGVDLRHIGDDIEPWEAVELVREYGIPVWEGDYVTVYEIRSGRSRAYIVDAGTYMRYFKDRRKAIEYAERLEEKYRFRY